MADRDIITRAGKGSALSATDNDQNLKALAGTVEEQTGTTYTVVYTDQNKTIELNNSSMVCTLTAISTIAGQIDTDNFEVTLINTNSTAATVNRSGTDTFTGGATSMTLQQGQSVTLQTDSTGGVWQHKVSAINTTSSSQRIDASGTTNSQVFYLGSSSLDNLSSLSLETDNGLFTLTNLGSTVTASGLMRIDNAGAIDTLFRSNSANQVQIQHNDGVQLYINAPATPTANTLYADSIVKAWASVSFSGGTPSLDDDVNISSVTDAGVGITRCNYATNMASINYSSAAIRKLNASQYSVYISTGALPDVIDATYNLTTSVTYISEVSGSPNDADFSVIVTGNQ